MSDARCERCRHKLLANENAVGVVVVKCDHCKYMNRVTLDRQSLAARCPESAPIHVEPMIRIAVGI